jgi:hypothetical protein
MPCRRLVVRGAGGGGAWPGRSPCGADGAASPVLLRRGRTLRNPNNTKAANVEQHGQTGNSKPEGR